MSERSHAQEPPSVSDKSTMDGRACAGELWSGHVRTALTSFGIRGCGAALLGPGSEVLGFDDERSQDHDFGPRLQVFVPQVTEVDGRRIEEQLDAVLPDVVGGFTVRFPTTTDPVRRHRVTVTTAARFFVGTCGVDPSGGLSVDEWLRTPTQLLAAVTAGEVFADPSGEIGRCRDVLSWYPDDVWRYVLGCQWRRLAQHEPLLGRTAETGDDLGARLVSARLTGDLMRLAFLIERRWAPYAKWLGAAFRELDAAAEVAPHLAALPSTTSPQEREDAYLAAGAALAERFNALGLTAPVDVEPRAFHTRPYLVLGADRFASVCHDGLPLAALGWRGAVDQWVDNTDILTDSEATAELYSRTLDMPTLTTGRYRLRPFHFGDLDLIREASEDPFIPVLTTVPSTFTDVEGRAFIQRQWARSRTGEGYSWAIVHDDTDQAIGQIGLWLQNAKQGRAAIGYWIAPTGRGAGAAHHAVTAVTRYAFDALGLARLELLIEPWNVPSIRTAERSGFTREGLVRQWEQVGAERKDMWMYSRLDHDPNPDG